LGRRNVASGRSSRFIERSRTNYRAGRKDRRSAAYDRRDYRTDEALIDEVTTIEEPPAFTEDQPPVFKPHRTVPVESKPLEPIAPTIWDAIDVNKVKKRTFNEEEREEIMMMDLKGERLAIRAKVRNRYSHDLPHSYGRDEESRVVTAYYLSSGRRAVFK
jgi:hypothetical protein